jgi:hypothetical protein
MSFMPRYDFEANRDKEFLLTILGSGYPVYGTIAEVRERTAHSLRFLSIGELERTEPELRPRPAYIFKIKINSVCRDDPPTLRGWVWEYDLHHNRLQAKRRISVYLKLFYDRPREGQICCL